MVNIYTWDRQSVWWAWNMDHANDVLRTLQRANPRTKFYVIDHANNQEYRANPLRQKRKRR